jgi:hypothetical protein
LSENTDPEEIKNLKRMSIQVMDEENLPRILTDETEKLNLENHYWITNSFFGKLGRLAPNLTQLSLRRMPHVSNISFADIFTYLTKLVTADFSGCSQLHSSSIQLLAKNNQQLEDLQVSGCPNAVDDSALRMISSLGSLQFLDISYSKKVTDAGMAHFANKKLPLNTLVINSCLGISSNGANTLISACSETLIDFEAAFNSQPEMKSELFTKLAVCWNL